jgi:thioredoxin
MREREARHHRQATKGSAMSENAQLVDLTDTEFTARVLEHDKPVLVDFWAPWCGPCKALTPTIEKLAAEYAGRLTVAKMDIQAHPQTAGSLGIMSIPALFFFNGGRVVDTIMGAAKEDKIRSKIESILGGEVGAG